MKEVSTNVFAELRETVRDDEVCWDWQEQGTITIPKPKGANGRTVLTESRKSQSHEKGATIGL